MGTDIHLSAEAEVFDADGKHKGWEWIPGPIKDCWACEGTGERPDRTTHRLWPCHYCTNEKWVYDDEVEINDRYVEPGKERQQWYEDRNYVAFAALANVRNGYGFAGVYVHEPIPSIAANRGTPQDVTPESLAILSNEHSPSWVMLHEVFAYNWGQPLLGGEGGTVGEYCEGFLQAMKDLAATAGERPVRLVFDFDS